jgi:hypothetical protein
MTRHLRIITAIVFLLGVACAGLNRISMPALAQTTAASPTEVAALRAEVEALKRMMPDQAHAMSDVDYQFANLWFAGQNANWSLAEFYLNETRSHLNWAVRLRPVRKLSTGADLDVASMLRGIENSSLADLKISIARHDTKLFEAGYRQAITECYGCHKAAEKPYLRPQIPERPASQMINMRVHADWPQ